MSKTELPITHLSPHVPGSSQCVYVDNDDGWIQIYIALEPFNKDLSYGLHVSIKHEDRNITDEECGILCKRLFKNKKYQEENFPNNQARHFWEVD